MFCGDRGRLDAVGRERARRGGEVRFAARGDRHARAFGGERPRAREPDALAAAGDQHDRVLQAEIHGAIP
jgi:hypothetical protein